MPQSWTPDQGARGVTCPACGLGNETGARVCRNCGLPIASAATPCAACGPTTSSRGSLSLRAVGHPRAGHGRRPPPHRRHAGGLRWRHPQQRRSPGCGCRCQPVGRAGSLAPRATLKSAPDGPDEPEDPGEEPARRRHRHVVRYTCDDGSIKDQSKGRWQLSQFRVGERLSENGTTTASPGSFRRRGAQVGRGHDVTMAWVTPEAAATIRRRPRRRARRPSW